MKLNGIVCVLLAAISYGIPASLMKLALTSDGPRLGMILLLMFLMAMIILNVCCLLQAKTKAAIKKIYTNYAVILSGISIGLTNGFYFYSLNYISVSLVAVMLMQSVWISILLSCLLYKKTISALQIIAIIGILIGTIFATDLINDTKPSSLFGLALAFISGFCYALTLLFTRFLGLTLSPLDRSALMSIGSFFIVLIIFSLGWPSLYHIQLPQLLSSLSWATLIACFAMVIPLIFLSVGMPKVAPGIGEILSSLELPSTIFFAWLLLGEVINFSQLAGVILIVISIMLANIEYLKQRA